MIRPVRVPNTKLLTELSSVADLCDFSWNMSNRVYNKLLLCAVNVVLILSSMHLMIHAL